MTIEINIDSQNKITLQGPLIFNLFLKEQYLFHSDQLNIYCTI